eukprot:485_1
MGNQESNIVLNTKWSPEEVSKFMLQMDAKQTKIVFEKHDTCTPQNLHQLLENSVVLYLLNVNVATIKDAKVQEVDAKLQEFKQKGTIGEGLDPVEKFILENKMKGNHQTVEMTDYPDVIGTWVQQFQSTMDTL